MDSTGHSKMSHNSVLSFRSIIDLLYGTNRAVSHYMIFNQFEAYFKVLFCFLLLSDKCPFFIEFIGAQVDQSLSCLCMCA